MARRGDALCACLIHRRHNVEEGQRCLDEATADEILEWLLLLQREYGKTVIMVTHDPKAAASASRVLYMDKRRLIDGGSDHDVSLVGALRGSLLLAGHVAANDSPVAQR